MASITCTAGSQSHKHDSVEDARYCWAQFHDQQPDKARARVRAVGSTRTDGERPKTEAPASEPGFYLKDFIYYKVQQNQDKTRVYAKRLEAPVGGKMCWVYDRGAIYNLKASHKISAEQATEFGKLYSTCIRCFRDLTREESVRRGYGPICADHEGWPYDHSADDSKVPLH